MSEHTNREQDTREQLEAEVMVTVGNLVQYCDAHPVLFEKAKSWLDRQAAITERELCARCTPYATTKDYLDTIDKLTTERDILQAAIDAMENGQFYAMYKAKCEECEQLKKVVRTQADSFKKLEIELAGKDG